MADKQLHWNLVLKRGMVIGAIGFLGDKAVVVTAFYDDLDAN